MDSNFIKSDLEKLLDNLKLSDNTTEIKSNEGKNFDFNIMFKELENILDDYKKENLKKSIDSEKELTKCILTY